MLLDDEKKIHTPLVRISNQCTYMYVRTHVHQSVNIGFPGITDTTITQTYINQLYHTQSSKLTSNVYVIHLEDTKLDRWLRNRLLPVH